MAISLAGLDADAAWSWLQRLRSALPTAQAHFLLVRDLATLGTIPAITGIEPAWVTQSDDPLFDEMVRICAEQGLDRDWCREQLEAQAGCVLAMADDVQRAVGVGLVTRRPFWVAEVGQTFQPGDDGCYLYGTYVSPSHRGRRIQRLLDGHRMLYAQGHGARVAYAIVEADNTASFKGHLASGFRPAVRLDVFRWGNNVVVSKRKLRPNLPVGRFVYRGCDMGNGVAGAD